MVLKKYDKITVSLVGARGYVGQELMAILSEHPAFELSHVFSREHAGKKVSDIYSDLSSDLVFTETTIEKVSQVDTKVIILALPNGFAHEYFSALSPGREDCLFIDLSSDFRFDDSWTYGLPEKNAKIISQAKRISNPGCYATAVQLCLLPLLGKVSGSPSFFGVSGYSGAGTKKSDKNNPELLKDNLIPYGMRSHTHEREVNYQNDVNICFMPSVAQFFRGIQVSCSIDLSEEFDLEAIQEQFRLYYKDHHLVHLRFDIPTIKEVRNQNTAIVGGFNLSKDGKNLRMVSVIDNLLKGAASQAVQNLNLASKLPQYMGLKEI